MNTIFVGGTDTDVGKTFISAQLLAFLQKEKIRTGYQKWVSTGDKNIPADLLYCMETTGMAPDLSHLDLHVPFRFNLPASPHLAAEQEHRSVNQDIIVHAYKTLSDLYELLIVEGVGGLFVPLTRKLLLIDLLANLKPSVLLVTRSGLGTLNHTLLSLEALNNRKIPVLGVIFSDTHETEEQIVVNDNMKTVAEIAKVKVFGRMPRIVGKNVATKAASAFLPIGHKLLLSIRENLEISVLKK